MSERASAGRGALAQVIATRGGLASPEAPFVIEHREALIYMLCEAAELEHAIMCQYLYAAFSLKQSTEEGLTVHELEAVERWRKTVSHIGTQEMLHLALVENLLSAVGAAPHLTRPNLPQPAGHYPPGVVLALMPFGEPALRHFMFLERPEGMDLDDAPGLAAAERAAPIMQEGEIVPRLQDFATVGHLYRSIEEGIKHLCARYGEPWLFVGPPEAQATREHFSWPELVQVTDAASALLAIETILDQGEGPRGHWRKAHFGRFVEILDEYLHLKEANPSFEPARPVLPATVRPSEGDQTTPLIGDPFTARCADLFNIGYEILLQTLERYFAHTEESDAELATLAQVTLGLMFNVIKPLGELVTTLPVGEEAPGRSAGPSFELFYQSDYLLPHRDAAWALIEERLREAAAFADRVKCDGAPDVAVLLEPIGPALLDLAHTLAARRADWGGASHAGEVTVAHRRRDAELARAAPGVADQVERLVSALKSALRVEQAHALTALFAAASLQSDGADAGIGEDQSTMVRGWKRGLLVESDRHFEHAVDVAELLIAVNGDIELELPSIGDFVHPGLAPFSAETIAQLPEDRNAELAAAYENITGCLRAVPPAALVVDPHPSPTTSHAGQRPLAAVVDQASALAVIEAISAFASGDRVGRSAAPGEPPGLEQIGEQLRDATTEAGNSFEPTRKLGLAPHATGADIGAHEPNSDSLSTSLARIFWEGYQLLLASLSRGTLGEPDPFITLEHRREITTRLRERVLRPLAEALFQLDTGPLAMMSAGLQPARHGREEPLEKQLRSLALVATKTRAEFPAGPAELLEGTAGLQDLAATYATASDLERASFLAQCRAEQSGLDGSIQLVGNGPYLLTNIDRLDDWLGVAIPTRPQMALCRCGQSSAKPWCDGSHAHAAFTGEKDPNRVPDQRDSYEGLAVTVFDNRGICQHSGYCTDRLASAFRVGQEPFVAASGGRMDEIIRAVRSCPSGALSFALDGHEARDTVDWHSRRPAAVTVTKDGPYRVTGTIPLRDEVGATLPRNAGASLEHYALCRCGHSQNKPFCSGMHWYVEFRDPNPDPDRTPSIFEWCGGFPALNRMTRLFFERYVPEDPLLAPLFAEAPADHPERVAMWLGEVFGGPPLYQENHGDYAHMLGRHSSAPISEEQRARWVSLLRRSAQETGLAADPESWSAFTSYIEWESQEALRYSQPDAAAPADARSPRWDWGAAGPPKPAAGAVAAQAADEVAMPGEGQAVSFDSHIKSLFRQHDRQSMAFAFDLWSCEDVKEHADAILTQLRAGTMPCDGPWSEEKTAVFQRWIADGMPA